MDHSEPPREGRGLRQTVIILGVALVLLVVAGSLFSSRTRLQAQLREELRSHTSEREKLAARIDTLQTTVDGLTGEPITKPDTALDEKMVALEAKIDALDTRIDALEKASEVSATPTTPPVQTAVIVPAPEPAPAPVAAPPPMNLDTLKLAVIRGTSYKKELDAWLAQTHSTEDKSTSALSKLSATGIPSEPALNRQLRDALEAAAKNHKVDDVSLAGKVNTHLAGLVTIKKSADTGTYTRLRDSATSSDIDTLIREVEQLESTTRAPLESWLEAAKTRRAALDELDALEPEIGH